MSIIYHTRVFLLITAAALALSGCQKSGGNDSGGKNSGTSESRTSKEQNVKMNEKRAEFPQILSELGEADVLSNEVFTTFDEASVMVEPETQPFEGYKCTACVAENYYIFMTENGYGLLNGLGEEIIKPEGIEKLSAVSNELICANLGKGKRVYYKLSEGSARVVDNMDFDGSRINFELLTDGDEEYQDSNHFVVTLDGERIYDSKWTSFEIVDPKKLDTSRNCSSVYSAWNGTGKYYLVFDRYYNLTVYKAEYAKVMLKIGEDYGECYITDPDDYDDLVTLINSFGNEGRDNTAETGSGGDYIKIAGGLSSEESKWVKTLTADGYCYTESFEDEDGSADISVDVMNPRTYTDLVDWTEAAVTSEYGTK
ncbi:MAG: hypothetical protein J6M17_01965 [Ruminococcus sp.]|nr:hypothetical protein [Ruminococcus sp.]